MKIVITGAAGMIGRKLTARLIADGKLTGRQISGLHLQDIVPVDVPRADFTVTAETSDLANPGVTEALAAREAEVIFHLAGVVSGEAERDFDKGYRANLDGARALFDAIRLREDYCPRVVYASSIAVFGAPFPDAIGDDFQQVPLTSYGAQKLIGELLLGDYSRRGFLDGIGLRLPTICVRPGKPNLAASGFFSSIIREPLAGKPAVLPVSRDVVHTHASPRSAVGFLLHAAGLSSERLGARRNVTLPGVAVSIGEQIEALRRVAGDKAVALIRDEPDPETRAIVDFWPQRFDARRARDLGFTAETTFDDIIKVHVEDELGGSL